MITGNEGILNKSKEAVEKYKSAELKEKVNLAIAGLKIGTNGKMNAKEVEKELEKIGVIVEGDNINPDDEPQFPLKAEIEGEKYTIVESGMYKVVIPKGFYYVGGTENTGIVITDNEVDENKYSGQTNVGTDLEGNQFVWVPVDGTTLTYAQDHTYDSKHQSAYTHDPENSTTKYTDWTDDGGKINGDGTTKIDENKASIAENGGFYIARYKVPISKAGVPSWNYISQTNAKQEK